MQATRICTVAACDRPVRRTVYCNAHLARLNRLGDVQAHKPIRNAPKVDERDDITARILAQSTPNDKGCLVWTGRLCEAGYGRIGWQGGTWYTHRAIWTHTVGEIPTGRASDGSEWTIDHLCSNRACVNVGHMEVVSRIENTRRGGGLPKAILANRKAAAEKPLPAHGTRGRYDFHACRCTECRAANTAAASRYRARKRQESK